MTDHAPTAAPDRGPLRDAITGLHALVSQLRMQIGRQLECAALEKRPEARRVLAEIEPRLFAHAEALELRLKLLQAEPSTLQQAAGSVVGTLATWVETMRGDETVSRILRDDFVAVSLALAQTQLVEATAESLDEAQTAEILREQRAALHEALGQIENAIPAVLRCELVEERKAAIGKDS